MIIVRYRTIAYQFGAQARPAASRELSLEGLGKASLNGESFGVALSQRLARRAGGGIIEEQRQQDISKPRACRIPKFQRTICQYRDSTAPTVVGSLHSTRRTSLVYNLRSFAREGGNGNSIPLYFYVSYQRAAFLPADVSRAVAKRPPILHAAQIYRGCKLRGSIEVVEKRGRAFNKRGAAGATIF